MRSLLTRLAVDEQAQDLIEYALLCAGLGFVGVATFPALEAAIGTAYIGLDSNAQNLWEPPAPGVP